MAKGPILPIFSRPHDLLRSWSYEHAEGTWELEKFTWLQVKRELKAQQLPLNGDIQRTQTRCQDQPCPFAVLQGTLKGTALPVQLDTQLRQAGKSLFLRSLK